MTLGLANRQCNNAKKNSCTVHRFLRLASLAAVLCLNACSSIDEEELGPAELLEFNAERFFVKQWSESIGDGQGKGYNRLRPAVDDTHIYIASNDGDVEALSLDEGDSLWDISLDYRISGAVSVVDGHVYIGTLAGELLALDKTSGELLWQSQLGGEILAAAAADGERVFVQTLDDQLIALNANTGERVWSYRNTMPVLTLRGTSTPLYHRGIVAAGFANGKVLGFDAETGSLRWEVRVSTSKGNSEIERIVDIDGDLLLEDGTLYAVGYQGTLTAIEMVRGKRLWAREASSYVGMGYGFNNVYVSGFDGSLIAFADTGQGVRWEQTVLARRKLTDPITLGNYVIVGDAEGYLHAMSQLDGHIAARIKVDSDGLQTSMQVHNDTLYVFSNDGSLSAYTLLDKPRGFFSF